MLFDVSVIEKITSLKLWAEVVVLLAVFIARYVWTRGSFPLTAVVSVVYVAMTSCWTVVIFAQLKKFSNICWIVF